ncbi:hypothetical protein [Bradyrhizobium sp. Leo121]|uniref:hypothetical protein n=1 Tax=Bradyrhizobium sp. Leo121 TaxID=1571195 RepID=UPI001029CE59|nr:hypothetical protein [Bradyrhizobium sp. Leo121]RZN21126.1 hypothetical protein CWO90_33540 [Bradyrhizobium sp. Leo121]
MTAINSYSTGTVSVANGDTVIVGSSTIWSAANARAGDVIIVDDLPAVEIKDVSDTTHLTLWSPWTGGAKSGVNYKIIQKSPLRFAGADAMASVSKMVAALNTDGFYVFVAPDLTEPDPSLGEEDQFALQVSTGKLWLKTGGVWVFQGVYKGFSIKGPWSAATAYQVGDVVSLAGTSYVALLANTNQTPPNATYWDVLAAKGDKGDTGDTGPGYGGTSATSNAIGTGSKTLAIGTGYAYQLGDYVRAKSAANGANFMEGFVLAYTGGSITIGVIKTGGSGTISDWNVSLAGAPGTGDLLSTNNLSDLANKATARLNLALAVYVADRSALKALDTTKDTVAYLTEPGRQGLFVWRSGDYSGQVTNDPNEGVYIKATAVVATSGAWVRDGAWQTDGVDPRWFGAKFDWNGTTGTDDSAAIQAWVNFLVASGAPGAVPGLTSRINATVNITAPVYFAGNPLKSEFRITNNGAGFNITSQTVTLKGFRVTGDDDAAKTAQDGIKINGVNLVEMDGITFTNCYNSINANGVAFWMNFKRVRWFDCINAHMVATAPVVGPGFTVTVDNCEMIPSKGNYGFLWTGAGSAQFNLMLASPANLAFNTLRIISIASQAGEFRFTNSVFEGSAQSCVSIEGDVNNKINNVFFTSCYFNQNNASGGAINVAFANRLHLTDCYLGGFGYGVNVLSTGGLTNSTIKGGFAICVKAAVNAGSGSTISGLDVMSLDASACGGSLIDLSAALTALNITVSSPNPGPNTSPVLMPSGQGGNCRVIGNLGGKNKYHQSGNFSIALNGSTSLVVIPHSLVTTPGYFNAQNSSFLGGTAAIREVTATSSVVNVQLTAAPAAGTYTFCWEARV